MVRLDEMKLRSIAASLAPVLVSASFATAAGAPADSPPSQGLVSNPRLRLIIETDAGGDPDDEQSLVRFLLYANEWDIEGIIANRPKARAGENLNPERTGLGIVSRMIHAYGKCWTNLVQHDPRYPRPEQLLGRTVPGYDTDAGVDLIIAAVDRDDPRPVWFSNWGTDRGSAPSCLKRALDRVRHDRSQEGYARFKARLRLSSYDAFGAHSTSLDPPWTLWVDTFRPELDGKRWYHRFSALTARAGGFDLERDVRTGHGPLGALYPTNTTHPQKEGDTMCFLYLVPTGLNDPDEPSWGSWAGRYGLRDDVSGKPYYWANQVDAWQGTTNRDNTLKRWAADLQNDFRARLDWCVKRFAQANHPPIVVVNGVGGTEPLRLAPPTGSELRLDARGSRDPDGGALKFEWFQYAEPGTYHGPVTIQGSNGIVAKVQVPTNASGQSIHIVLRVADRGQPPLARYRRVIVTPKSADSAWDIIAPSFEPPSEFAGRFGSYRSPLTFRDGTHVKTRADWPRRRQEILEEWTTIMGPWPALLSHPKVEVLSSTHRDHFTQERVRIEIAPEQTGEGWLLTPDGEGPFPAVLVVYYEPETSIGVSKEPLRDFGYQLAWRGFVTLSIGTPGGNAWGPDIGKAQCQPLSFHAYVAANCWNVLAARPEVDSTRIGVVGHSYGGKWALFAAALWDKFAAVAVSDPGIVFDETRPNVNYWEPWYLGLDPEQKRPARGLPTATNPRTGAYKRLVETGHDLPELEALIAPRPLLVSSGAEDPPERWLALNYLAAVNELLGYTNRVAMTHREGHSPTEESNAQLYAFFEHFLRNAARDN